MNTRRSKRWWQDYCLLAWVLSAGCAQPESASSPVVVRDSAGIVIVENDLSRLTARCSVAPEPSVVIGSADGGTEYELYRVFGASRLSDGRIVLVNNGSSQLRFFDPSGRFLMNAGRAGGGPGEFQDAFYLWVLPGDTIWVGDYRPWQFLLFSPEGQWVRTVRPKPEYPNPPWVINVLDDGRSVLAERTISGSGPRFELRHITVVVHAPDGILLDTVTTLPNGSWGTVGDEPGSPGLFPLFESFAHVNAAGSRLVMGHGSEAEFTIIDADGGLLPDRIVRWTTESRTVSSEDVEAERNRILALYDDQDMDPGLRRVLVDPMVSDRRPVADRFPAFRSMLLGRDARIWIREYARPGETQTNEWTVFSFDGHFECRATLPADLDQILEFGPDYLLALDEDDLGVERVVQYLIYPAASDDTEVP